MSQDVMSRIEQLPEELRELIYNWYVKTHVIDRDLKYEIEYAKLHSAFRNVIGVLGFRNASWGFLYHMMTGNMNKSIRYKFVHYEPLVLDVWSSMTHEERDHFKKKYIIDQAYYRDDGLLEIS